MTGSAGRRRKGGGDGLFGYRSGHGWHDVTAADINAYLGEISGDEFTARDFRTWHATVLIAPALRDLGRNSEFGDLATRGAAPFQRLRHAIPGRRM